MGKAISKIILFPFVVVSIYDSCMFTCSSIHLIILNSCVSNMLCSGCNFCVNNFVVTDW